MSVAMKSPSVMYSGSLSSIRMALKKARSTEYVKTLAPIFVTAFSMLGRTWSNRFFDRADTGAFKFSQTKNSDVVYILHPRYPGSRRNPSSLHEKVEIIAFTPLSM